MSDVSMMSQDPDQDQQARFEGPGEGDEGHRTGAEAPSRGGVQTRWSMVLRAGGSNSAEADEAIEYLYKAYWRPLYAYLRRERCSHHEAEDLINELYIDLMSNERAWFKRPDRAKGRFRNFLMGMLKFKHSEFKQRAGAKKRGGTKVVISIDEPGVDGLPVDIADTRSPEELFKQVWIFELTQRALSRLESEWRQAGKAAFFDALVPHLLKEGPDESLAEVAKRFGDAKVETVRVSLFRLRRRCRTLIRAEIAETVGDDEVDAELRDLGLGEQALGA